MEPKLKMVTRTHIRQKPIGSYASPLIQKLGKSANYTTDEDDVDGVVDCSTSACELLFSSENLLTC